MHVILPALRRALRHKRLRQDQDHLSFFWHHQASFYFPSLASHSVFSRPLWHRHPRTFHLGRPCLLLYLRQKVCLESRPCRFRLSLFHYLDHFPRLSLPRVFYFACPRAEALRLWAKRTCLEDASVPTSADRALWPNGK